MKDSVSDLTDYYFTRTKKILEDRDDRLSVTYAFFMRRPVIFAPKLMLEWLDDYMSDKLGTYKVELLTKEGAFVGSGQPMLYLTGKFSTLVEVETLLLQRLGPACVAAMNAYEMAVALPNSSFLAMDGRHCAGEDMMHIMAYGCGVGSEVAKDKGAIGFIGNATNATAKYFGNEKGGGTMPHALIGYAGSTVKAAEMYRKSFPNEPMTVLVDYFGKEVTDTLAVAEANKDLVEKGMLAIRLDTHGGRYMEGLDKQESYAVLERNYASVLRTYRTEEELNWLIGPGVSAAAVWSMREKLKENGFGAVKIVASSGFNKTKCKLMGEARAPIDIVGTGSYLPEKWSETYATADIINYDGRSSVKIGREFLIT